MPHALALLQEASEALLSQQLSVLEWASQWRCCSLDISQALIPEELRRQSEACLERLACFAGQGQLSDLDRSLAELRDLCSQWDHWWWVSQRSNTPWPPPSTPPAGLHVTRQNGRSRVSWICDQCGWSLSWDLQVAAWESVEWPGPIECPLGCSTASCDGLRDDESPQNECAR
ncbi:hypothetical protein JST97_00475 [bacterium]|nr:hypothetical protein [bacterium]